MKAQRYHREQVAFASLIVRRGASCGALVDATAQQYVGHQLRRQLSPRSASGVALPPARLLRFARPLVYLS
jgi:hypothetical protein